MLKALDNPSVWGFVFFGGFMNEPKVTGEQFKKIMDLILDVKTSSVLVKSFEGDKCQSKK